MRASFLIPLAFVVVTAGCGSEPEESGHASTVPQRDLTLQPAPGPDMAVASRLEVPRPRPERPTVHRPRRSPDPALAPSRKSDATDAAPAADAVAVTTVAPAPAPSAAAPIVDEAAADPHALAPGRTVTIVPVSSGPSTGSGRVEDEMPSRAGRAIIMMGGGHGDTCRGHGAGALR
ncbi:MAG TPA: hypothetical protein VJQ44_06515 [Gemmatimonadales bacterium]|nr:hypothetical protein [Gemmatimonadales bacterium]